MPSIDDITEFESPLPTTDIIIEYREKGIEYEPEEKQGIVLVTRKNPPYGIAIPGGFAEYGLSYEENAVKEAKEETGLDVILESPERPFCVHSSPERDPRGHIASNTYIALGYGTLRAGDDAATAKLYSLDEVASLVESNGLAFDHGRILEKYLVHRGYKFQGRQQ